MGGLGCAEGEAPRTVRDLLREVAGRIDRLDAEVLLAHLLGVERLAMLADPARLVEQPGRLDALVARRMRGEPVAYISGEREFWSLKLRVTPDTLIPRPDSETLIAEALRHFAGRAGPGRVLDLGTGSGALLLAALHEWPGARGLGVDRSARALEVARANGRALRLDGRAEWRLGDWTEGLEGPFDLILCNPPYIPDGAVLMPDVADHEPSGALFAGADGLDCYRLLLPDMPRLLAPGGVALFEFGEGQAGALCAMAGAAGLAVEVAADLAGRPRVLITRAGGGGGLAMGGAASN